MHQLAKWIQDSFPAGFVVATDWRGDLAVAVKRENVLAVAKFLRDDPGMDFDYVVHVSSVDWPDDEERFEAVWEFYSIRKRHRIRLKTPEQISVMREGGRILAQALAAMEAAGIIVCPTPADIGAKVKSVLN